jgi:mRNA interferase RelE/StbE
MVHYEEDVLKAIQKGKISKDLFVHFNHIFEAVDGTRDFRLFDIKKLKGGHERDYYRLRKGNYRAVFYVEKGDLWVAVIAHRQEVYKKWE